MFLLTLICRKVGCPYPFSIEGMLVMWWVDIGIILRGERNEDGFAGHSQRVLDGKHALIDAEIRQL